MESSAPSPTKKAKLNKNDIDALEKLVQEGIEKATSREQAEELHFVLNKLANVAHNKKFELMKGSDDFRDGCLVELIDSNQSQDQDLEITCVLEQSLPSSQPVQIKLPSALIFLWWTMRGKIT